jgi:hypothetical protein
LPDPLGVTGWQHRREAAPGRTLQRPQDRLGAVSKHRPGVTEAQVEDPVAIDVGQLRARCLLYDQRDRHGPVEHPVQRHLVHESLGGSLTRSAAAGAPLQILPLLTGQQAGRTGRDSVIHENLEWILAGDHCILHS